MELSYSPSSSPLTLLRPNYKLSRLLTRKYSNLRKTCYPVSPSLVFPGYDPRPNHINVASIHYKLNSIRARSKDGSEAVTTKKARNFGEACWRLTRPYTIMGTAITASSLLVRVLIENPSFIGWSLILKVLLGFFPLMCANNYTTAINQIHDIEIDKINKPYLPIPAGDISVKSAWLLAAFFAVAGLSVVGLTCSPLITCAYGLALFLSTAYSVPPLRLKASVFGTIFSVTTAYGFLLNYGVYYSLRATLGLAFQWSTPLIYIVTFGLLINVALVITKDLPDVEGDAKFGISTLAIKLGVRNVAYLGSGLLLAYYAATVVAAVYMPQALNPRVIIPAHFVFALSLIRQMRVLEQANYHPDASLKFYMSIWNLYYAGYIVFPFI